MRFKTIVFFILLIHGLRAQQGPEGQSLNAIFAEDIDRIDTNIRPVIKDLNKNLYYNNFENISSEILKDYTLFHQKQNVPYYNFLLSACYINARNLTRAKELLQKETNDILIPYFLEKFGEIYTEKGELATAIKYFKLQYSNTESELMKGRALRNVGVSFQKQYQLDSAVEYLQLSSQYFEGRNDKFSLVNELNLAEIDKTRGFQLRAKQRLQDILKEVIPKNYQSIAKQSLLLLIEVHEDLYEFDSIPQYFESINQMPFTLRSEIKLAFLRYEMVYAPMNQIEKKEKLIYYKHQLQLQNNNRAVAFINLNESLKAHDSIINTNLTANPFNRLEGKDENQQLLKWWIIGLSIVFALGFLIIYIYNKNNVNKRIKALQKERHELHKRIERQNRELTDFAINLKRKRQFDEEFLKKVEYVKNSSFSHKEQIAKLSNELKNQVGQGYTHEILQENINELNSKFNAILTEKHENLISYDKELCGLIRLNFSNKEIANLKNISTQSARTAKYRLKQKLQLDAETDLVEYLQKL